MRQAVAPVATVLAALIVVACSVRPAIAQTTLIDTLVMPFENTRGEPRLYWLGEGSAVLLSELVDDGDSASAVPREERLRAFERLQLPAAPVLSHATVIKVGQLVGATEIVVGSYELADDRLTVRARVIKLDSGRMMPEIQESGPLAELVSIYARVAGKVRSQGPVSISDDALLASPPAFEAYVKGLVAETPKTQNSFLAQALKQSAGDARVRLAQWDVFNEQGQHQQAFDAANAVPATSRWARVARFSAAVSLIQLKRYDEAFGILKGLQTAQRSGVVLNAMGVVQLRRGGSPQSGRPTFFFSQATETDPGEGDYFFNLGYGYWLDRDPQAAIYWLREAVRRDPTDGEAHWMLGTVLQQTGALPEATRERELGRRLAPNATTWDVRTPSDQMPRGLERMKNRLERAGRRVDSLIAAQGQRDQASLAAFHLDAARRAFDREADRTAEQELRRALYLSPYLAEAHLLLGRVLLRGGRATDAVDALKIALWSQETAAAHLALAEAYLQLQENTLARAEAQRALALEPTSAQARQLLDRLNPK
jgi:tetratricopeptide (TPR) repeat protein/TolB-like protein